MADAQPGPPIGTVILSVLAVVFYAGMMGSLSDAPSSDAMGRGMALAFGAILATLLSIVLAILLLVAAVKGEMSLVGKIGVFILLPAATVAIWMAGDAYGRRDYSAIWVPALLPPVFLLYALRARFAPLRQKIREGAANATLLVFFLILAGVPLVRAAIPVPRDLAAEARAATEETERRAREEQTVREARAAEQARFAALGPDSSLVDYLDFAYGDRSIEAREGIRKVKSRQADAVALLNVGRLRDLSSLLEYDVAATPELCAAYGAALAKAAATVDPKVNSNYLGSAIDLEAQLSNLQWLVTDGCDLKAPLALLENNLRAVADPSRITKFADELAGLRARQP